MHNFKQKVKRILKEDTPRQIENINNKSDAIIIWRKDGVFYNELIKKLRKAQDEIERNYIRMQKTRQAQNGKALIIEKDCKR